MSKVNVQTIRDVEGFARLEGEWNELLAASSSNCAFLTFEWLFTWWQHLAGSRQLHLITVRQDGRLIGVAPLMRSRWRRHPFRIVPALEFVGSDHAGSDHLDIIARSGHERDVADAMASALAGGGEMLELSQMRSTGTANQDLVARLAGEWRADVTDGVDQCPFIPLSGVSWETFLDGLSSSHRKDFRRRLRILEREHAIEFGPVSTDAERQQALADLHRLHLARRQTRGGTMAIGLEGQDAFHERVTALFLERGWLRLLQLRLRGEVAAVIYGFMYGRKFYYFMPAFDEKFGTLGVGQVALGLAIQAAIAEGVDEFDLLRGAEPYKFKWTKHSRSLARLEAARSDWRNLLHRSTVGIRQWRRGLRARRTDHAQVSPSVTAQDQPLVTEVGGEATRPA